MFNRGKQRADKSRAREKKSLAARFLDFILGEKTRAYIAKRPRIVTRFAQGEDVAHVYPMLKANTKARENALRRRGFEILDLKEPTKFPGYKYVLPAGTHVIKLTKTKCAVYEDRTKYPPQTLRKINSLAMRISKREGRVAA